MHLLPALLLPLLTAATPLVQRQSTSGSIVFLSVAASGQGCPSGSAIISVDPSGNEVTVGFNQFAAEIGPLAPPELRELQCDLVVRASVPLQCSVASIETVYHGFGQLGDGARGTFAAQYSLSPGQITSGSNPPNAVVTSAGFGGAGNVYSKTDPVALRFNPGAPNNQLVDFTVRNRVFLQGANSTVAGSLSVDDATVRIVSQGAC